MSKNIIIIAFSRRFLDFNQQGLAIYSAHFRLLFY